VTPTCQELAPLLSLRAAGALDGEEAARVESHLATCAGCRAEAEQAEAALDLARLPPFGPAERRAAGELPERALAAFRRADARRGRMRRALAGFAVAAAAALALLAPALLRKPVHAPAAEQASLTWQSPDPDTLWSETDVLALDGSSDATDSSTLSTESTAVATADGF